MPKRKSAKKEKKKDVVHAPLAIDKAAKARAAADERVEKHLIEEEIGKIKEAIPDGHAATALRWLTHPDVIKSAFGKSLILHMGNTPTVESKEFLVAIATGASADGYIHDSKAIEYVDDHLGCDGHVCTEDAQLCGNCDAYKRRIAAQDEADRLEDAKADAELAAEEAEEAAATAADDDDD
jgi:hypothetical protein